MDTYKNEDFIRNDGPSHAVIYRSWAMPYHASSPWKLVKIMWHYVGNYVDEYNAFFTSVKWDLYIFFFFFLLFLVFFPSYHTLDTGWSSWLTEGSPSLGDSFGETSCAVDVVGDWMVIMAVDGDRDTDLWLMDVASSNVSSMSVKETDLALYHTTASTINANIITLPVIPGPWESSMYS